MNGMSFTAIHIGLDPREPPIPEKFKAGSVHTLSYTPLFQLVRFDDVGCLLKRRITVQLPGMSEAVTLDEGVVPIFPSACQAFKVDVLSLNPDMVEKRILSPAYDIVRVGFTSSLAYGYSDYKVQGDSMKYALVHMTKATGKDKVCSLLWFVSYFSGVRIYSHHAVLFHP